MENLIICLVTFIAGVVFGRIINWLDRRKKMRELSKEHHE